MSVPEACVACCPNGHHPRIAVELLGARLTPVTDKTAVYVALNSAGDVLYVGVTQTGLPRFSQHASANSHWWLLTERLVIRHFACRHDALDVEAFLIQALDPEWNTARPRRDFERGQRLAESQHFDDDLPTLARHSLVICGSGGST